MRSEYPSSIATVDTYFVVDIAKLRDAIGQLFITSMVADGDIAMAPDGRDIIRRERFTSSGWYNLTERYEVIGPEVTP